MPSILRSTFRLASLSPSSSFSYLSLSPSRDDSVISWLPFSQSFFLIGCINFASRSACRCITLASFIARIRSRAHLINHIYTFHRRDDDNDDDATRRKILLSFAPAFSLPRVAMCQSTFHRPGFTNCIIRQRPFVYVFASVRYAPILQYPLLTLICIQFHNVISTAANTRSANVCTRLTQIVRVFDIV